MSILFFAMLCVAYLLGSINSAIITSQLMNLPDPRSQGSGNPGATNVLRSGGRLPAVIVLAGDVLKGVVPVVVAAMLGVQGFWLGWIALAAIIGHMYPVFFKFEGGKGFATTLGAIFALSPLLLAIMLAVWVLVVAITRYVSLGSIIATVVIPIVCLLTEHSGYCIPLICIAALVVYRHHDNIERLRNGIENKLSF